MPNNAIPTPPDGFTLVTPSNSLNKTSINPPDGFTLDDNSTQNAANNPTPPEGFTLVQPEQNSGTSPLSIPPGFVAASPEESAQETAYQNWKAQQIANQQKSFGEKVSETASGLVSGLGNTISDLATNTVPEVVRDVGYDVGQGMIPGVSDLVNPNHLTPQQEIMHQVDPVGAGVMTIPNLAVNAYYGARNMIKGNSLTDDDYRAQYKALQDQSNTRDKIMEFGGVPQSAREQEEALAPIVDPTNLAFVGGGVLGAGIKGALESAKASDLAAKGLQFATDQALKPTVTGGLLSGAAATAEWGKGAAEWVNHLPSTIAEKIGLSPETIESLNSEGGKAIFGMMAGWMTGHGEMAGLLTGEGLHRLPGILGATADVLRTGAKAAMEGDGIQNFYEKMAQRLPDGFPKSMFKIVASTPIGKILTTTQELASKAGAGAAGGILNPLTGLQLIADDGDPDKIGQTLGGNAAFGIVGGILHNNPHLKYALQNANDVISYSGRLSQTNPEAFKAFDQIPYNAKVVISQFANTIPGLRVELNVGKGNTQDVQGGVPIINVDLSNPDAALAHLASHEVNHVLMAIPGARAPIMRELLGNPEFGRAGLLGSYDQGVFKPTQKFQSFIDDYKAGLPDEAKPNYEGTDRATWEKLAEEYHVENQAKYFSGINNKGQTGYSRLYQGNGLIGKTMDALTQRLTGRNIYDYLDQKYTQGRLTPRFGADSILPRNTTKDRNIVSGLDALGIKNVGRDRYNSNIEYQNSSSPETHYTIQDFRVDPQAAQSIAGGLFDLQFSPDSNGNVRVRQRTQAEAKKAAQQQARIWFKMLSAQDKSKLPAQDKSKLPAQDKSKLPAQDESKLPAQDKSKLPAQDESKLPAQDKSKLPAQDESKLPAQDKSKLPAQDESKLPDQDESKLPAQDKSKLPAQDESKLPAQDKSKLPAQDESKLPAQDESKLPAQDKSKLPAQDESKLPAQDESKLPDQDESKLPDQDESKLPDQDESKLPDQDESKLPEGAMKSDGKVGYEGRFLTNEQIDKLVALNGLNKSQEQNIRQLSNEAQTQNGKVNDITYFTATKETDRSKYATLGTSTRPAIFYGFYVGKKGTVLARMIDLEQLKTNYKMQSDKILKSGKTLPIQGHDVDQALQDYLKNHERGYQGDGTPIDSINPPTEPPARVFSKPQKNFLNELFGISTKPTRHLNDLWQQIEDEGGKHSSSAFKAFRMDRLSKVEDPSDPNLIGKRMPFDYPKVNRNYSPNVLTKDITHDTLKPNENDESRFFKGKISGRSYPRNPEAAGGYGSISTGLKGLSDFLRGKTPRVSEPIQSSGVGSSIPTSASPEFHKEIFSPESKRLGQIVDQKGLRTADPSTLNLAKVGKGFEHEVFDNGATVLKRTLPGGFGVKPELFSNAKDPDLEGPLRIEHSQASPADYPDKVRLANEVFGDEGNLKGVVKFNDQSGNFPEGNGLSFVTEQPYRKPLAVDPSKPIDAKTNPTVGMSAPDIEIYMRDHGFKSIPDEYVRAFPLGRNHTSWYRDDGVIATDTHGQNFIKTAQGDVAIDVPLSRISPEQVKLLKQAYDKKQPSKIQIQKLLDASTKIIDGKAVKPDVQKSKISQQKPEINQGFMELMNKLKENQPGLKPNSLSNIGKPQGLDVNKRYSPNALVEGLAEKLGPQAERMFGYIREQLNDYTPEDAKVILDNQESPKPLHGKQVASFVKGLKEDQEAKLVGGFIGKELSPLMAKMAKGKHGLTPVDYSEYMQNPLVTPTVKKGVFPAPGVSTKIDQSGLSNTQKALLTKPSVFAGKKYEELKAAGVGDPRKPEELGISDTMSFDQISDILDKHYGKNDWMMKTSDPEKSFNGAGKGVQTAEQVKHNAVNNPKNLKENFKWGRFFFTERFPIAGQTKEDRVSGNLIVPGGEWRVHLAGDSKGNIKVIPWATIRKNGVDTHEIMPETFNHEELNDVEKAAQEWANKLPLEDRINTIRGVDMLRLEDGTLKPAEFNPFGIHNMSGYFASNPAVQDAYLSALKGELPHHARVARILLKSLARGDKL